MEALVALVVVACVYGYYQKRIGDIKRQKAVLEKQVQERTATVQQQVEELQAQSEELTQQASHLKELNEQLEAQKEQELEKAVAQNKFEISWVDSHI